MIARTWRGAVRAEDAEAYAEYIRETGLAAYVATDGNRGAHLLWRVDGDVAEVLTVSFWDSFDAIKGFAGADVDQAVFYPEDDRYLVERDLVAGHWQVVEPAAAPPSRAPPPRHRDRHPASGAEHRAPTPGPSGPVA